MRITKNILISTIAFFISLIMFSSFIMSYYNVENSAQASEETTETDSITWNFDSETKILTISGTGAMEDYTQTSSPSYKNRRSIEKVVIESGITTIGAYTFYNLSKLTSVVLPDTLIEIKKGAFQSCTLLTDINFPDSLTKIGDDAFCSCGNLSAFVPYNVESIGDSAFLKTKKLIYSSSTTLGGSNIEIGTIIRYDATVKKNTLISISNVYLSHSSENVVIIPSKLFGLTIEGVSGLYKSNALSADYALVPDSTVASERYDLPYFTYTTDSDTETSIVSANYKGSQYDTTTVDISAIEYIDDRSIKAIYLPTISGFQVTSSSNIPRVDYTINSDNTIKITNIENVTDKVVIPDKINGISVDSVDSSLKDKISVDSNHTHKFSDGVCTICFEEENTKAYELKGYSLSLAGDISINFYMQIDTEKIDSDSYMKFDLPDDKTETVALKNAKISDGYYVFSCELSAKEMTETINATFVSGANSDEYSYSVRKYADTVLNLENNFDEKTINLVKAMLDYGAKAQTYFDYNTDNMANKDIEISENSDFSYDLSGIENEKISDSSDGIEYYGSSLLLKSKIVLRHYFKLSDGYEIVDYNFGKYQATLKDNYYYVDITDISAYDLDKTKTLTVTKSGDEDSVLTVAYSPLNYINKVLDNESSSEDIKSLVKSLYYYHKMTVEYAK